MAMLQNLLGLGAAQDVGDMRGAEQLAGLLHAGQEGAGWLGQIDLFSTGLVGQAVVAGVAGLAAEMLAEIGQQGRAPAAAGLGVAQHGLQAGCRAGLLGRRSFLDEILNSGDILLAVEQQALRRQPIAAGTADLLIVALQVLGQVEVEDEAHVGLVDAHAEGDGGHHDGHIRAHKVALVAPPRGIVQTGMIG
jgi:hypothetical protein